MDNTELINKVNKWVTDNLESDLNVLFNKKNVHDFAFKEAWFDYSNNTIYIKFDACDQLMKYSSNAEFVAGISFKVEEMIDPTYAAYLDTSMSVNCTDDFERLRYRVISAVWSVYQSFIYYKNTEDRALVKDKNDPDKDLIPSKYLLVWVQRKQLDYSWF